MTDQQPQNREERRRAKFGRHRVDARAAHDPWPTSEPNPALSDVPAAGRTEDQAQAGPANVGATDAEPDEKTSSDEAETAQATPKG